MPELPPNRFSNLTSVALGAVGASTLVGVLAITFQHSGASWKGEAAILLGLILVMLLLWLVVRWVAGRKNRPFVQKLQQAAGVTPNALTAVAARAKLDDLRRSFEAGITKFRATGKDIYKLPWYLLVGEPGSGKTEAIRHSNLPFPPGLQDSLQGTGGTVNMNWWLTNQAVILDTAGRYLFGELQPGTAAEWTEFLRLLVKYRPQCPINGLILVIPAESLIIDTADKIEAKAATIAQQLDRIQRALEVRFPVYVIVTKCDLINGFREFFESLDNPQLQHQILGWSNPRPLDEPFNPEQVEAHLDEVHKRLSQRRLGLLLDPVAHEGMESRRINEVDSLYSFPDSFRRLGPRLARYLALVFVAGEWSPKPLFLRGIYFTSSMREGQALDAELADLLHVPIDSLRERRVWERDRAFFLRDVLLKKAFPEQGLVTRAPNTRKAAQTRKVALLSTGFIAAIVILAFSLWGNQQLRSSISDKQTTFWSNTTQLKQSDGVLQILDSPGIHPKSRLSKTVADDGGPSVGQFYGDLNTWANQDVHVQPVFRPAAFLLQMKDQSNDINESQKDDAGNIYAANVLAPLIKATRNKIESITAPAHWDDDSTAALKELIRFECGKPPNITILFAYVTDKPIPKDPIGSHNPPASQSDEEKYVNTLSEGLRVFEAPIFKHLPDFIKADTRAIPIGISTAINYYTSNVKGPSVTFKTYQSKFDKLLGFYNELHTFCQDVKKSPPTTVLDYERRWVNWKKLWDTYSQTYKDDISPILKALESGGNSSSLVDLYQKEQANLNKDAKGALNAIDREIDTNKLPSDLHSKLTAAINSMDLPIAPDLKANLLSLGASWLKVPEADPKGLRLVQMAHDLYAKATAGMPDPDGSAAAVMKSGPMRSGSSTPSALSPNKPEEFITFVTGDATALAEHMTAPYVNYKSIWKQISDLPDETTILARIKTVTGSRPVVQRPVIPLTKPDANVLGANFDSEAAGQVLVDAFQVINGITSQLQEKPVAKVLESASLLKMLSTRKQPAENYLRKYVEYWSKVSPIVDSHFETWKQAWDRLPDPDATNRQWRELAQMIANALVKVRNIVPGQSIGEDAIKRASKTIDIGKDTAANDRIRNTWGSWKSLNPDSVSAARRTLLEKTAADVRLQYIVNSKADNDIEDYWNAVTVSMLGVLAEDHESKSILDSPNYDGFPLKKNTMREISIVDMQQLRSTLEQMSLWNDVANQDKSNVKKGSRLGSAEGAGIDKYLDKLAHGGLDDKDYLRLGRIYRLVSALPKTAQSGFCSVSIPKNENVDRLQRLVTSPLRLAYNQWVEMALATGDKPDRGAKLQTHLPGALGRIAWPADRIEFDFYQNNQVLIDRGDPIRIADKTLIKQWQVLCLVANYDPVPASEDDTPISARGVPASKKWYVRLRPEFGLEKIGGRDTYAQWLLLTFEDPIPDPSTWSN